MPMLAISNLRARSLDIERIELAWEFDGYDDPNDYTIQVVRSESPEGPFEAMTAPFEDRYIFVDSRIPRGDKFRQLYYKLIVTHKSSAETAQFGPVTNAAEPDLIASYIRIHELTMFTQANGRLVWLFKARTFGARCKCYDAISGQRKHSRCLTCFNRTFIRGYHNPIEVWAQIDPAGKANQDTSGQKAQHVYTTARIPYFPVVSPNDLIVEAENKRWEITKVTQTERLRAVLRQELTLRQLETTDIEYSVPIKLDHAVRDLSPSPVRMYTNATNLASAIHDRVPDVFANYETYPKDPTR